MFTHQQRNLGSFNLSTEEKELTCHLEMSLHLTGSVNLTRNEFNHCICTERETAANGRIKYLLPVN